MKIDLSFLRNHRLEVYATTWCPDCRRLDRWLAANAVAHETIDIDRVDGAAEKLEEETGKRGVPYVLVDGRRWVRGYHKESPARFDPQLFVAELTVAVHGQSHSTR